MLRASSKVLSAWLAGTAIAYALASVAHTQTVIGGLTALGVHVPLDARVATTVTDLAGLWRYALVIGIGLALALTTMRFLPERLLPLPRSARAALAGALALGVILGAMRLAFSFTPIASAREPLGFALQCMAGAVGGWAYARLVKARAPSPDAPPEPTFTGPR